jgi:uncharacterized protein (TIGR00369 family)
MIVRHVPRRKKMSRLLVGGNTPRVAETEQFTMAGWLDMAPFEALLGMTINSAADGRAVLSMPFTVKLAQGGGLLHGGALTALADTAVAMAVKSLLAEGTRFATRQLTMRFVAPVREGIVTATAELERCEGRSYFARAVLADQGGTRVAEFSAEFRLARTQPYGQSDGDSARQGEFSGKSVS